MILRGGHECNFSENCVVLGKHGEHRGHEGLKELAQLLREEIDLEVLQPLRACFVRFMLLSLAT